MKLEVGEFYLNASGEIVKIEKNLNNRIFIDTNDNWYNENGILMIFEIGITEDEFDLIAHIPKELHWSIVSQVYSYYKNVNARNKIIRRHKNFFNKKKTIIPD